MVRLTYPQKWSQLYVAIVEEDRTIFWGNKSGKVFATLLVCCLALIQPFILVNSLVVSPPHCLLHFTPHPLPEHMPLIKALVSRLGN